MKEKEKEKKNGSPMNETAGETDKQSILMKIRKIEIECMYESLCVCVSVCLCVCVCESERERKVYK